MESLDIENWTLQTTNKGARTFYDIEGATETNIYLSERGPIPKTILPYGFDVTSKFKNVDLLADRVVTFRLPIFLEQVPFFSKVDQKCKSLVEMQTKNAYQPLLTDAGVKVKILLQGRNKTQILFKDGETIARGSGGEFFQDILGNG